MLRPVRLTTLLLLALAACGGGSTAPAIIESTTFASALGVDLSASTKADRGYYYRDIEVGTGSVVGTAHHLLVHYSGWFPDGTLFDSNQDPDDPFTFDVGAGQVIVGWDLGVVGMRVGGTRQLIIPPGLGYGSADYGQIPGNSILVFNIQVVSLQ
jgi:FKBP-type peptidyl-prolyl cis-trans isomerase FkpA